MSERNEFKLNVWVVLALAALVFEVGIAGRGLNAQVGPDLAAWGWGYFGAAIMSLAVWGGVARCVRRDWWGVLVVFGGVIGSIGFGAVHYMDYHWLGSALLLSLVAPAIAVGAEIVGTRAVVAETTAAETERRELDAEQRAWERERQRLADEHAAKLAELQVIEASKTERARLKSERLAEQNAEHSERVHRPERTSNGAAERYRPVIEMIQAEPFITVRELNARTGISTGAISEFLGKAGYHKNGAGWKMGEE